MQYVDFFLDCVGNFRWIRTSFSATSGEIPHLSTRRVNLYLRRDGISRQHCPTACQGWNLPRARIYGSMSFDSSQRTSGKKWTQHE